MASETYGEISWKQKMKNEDVLKSLKLEKTLLYIIKASKLKFSSYTKRYDSIMKNILEGKMEGREDHEAGHGLSGATTARSGQGTA